MEGVISRIYEVRIPIFRQEKEKTVYYIIIVNRQTGAVISLRKRYSELRTLHERLEKKIKEYRLEVYLPVYPGRKLIQKTNNNKQKVEGRKQELEEYLTELFKIGKLHSLDLLKDYLPTTRRILQSREVGSSVPSIPISEFAESGFFKSRLSQVFQKDTEQELLMVDGGEKEHRIRVTIERYNYMDDTMYFYVTFYDNKSKDEWVYRTRYSTLKRFHETLCDKNLKAYLLKFPSRKLFGITNEDPDSIEKRRKELEDYLDHALSQDPVLNNEYVKYFLEDTKSQYIQFKKQEELKKKKMKKMAEEKRKAASEANERGHSKGMVMMEAQGQSGSTTLNTASGENGQPKSALNSRIPMLVDSSRPNEISLSPSLDPMKDGGSKKRTSISQNPAFHKGMLKSILTIIPEEINVVYVEQ